MNPPPGVNQCYVMIIQDESQRVLAGEHSSGSVSVDPTTLFSHRSGSHGSSSGGLGYPGGAGSSNGNSGASSSNRSRRSPHVYCDFCNMRCHSKEACYKLLQCSYCNMKGHTKETCYKLIGYPADYKGKKKINATSTMPTQSQINTMMQPYFTQDQYNQILRMLNKPIFQESNANQGGIHASNVSQAGIFASTVFLTLLPHRHAKWIVDSGATDHMVSSNSLLNVGLSVPNPSRVQLPNGDSDVITQSGNCQLNGGDVVHNVLCVPTFQFNLLSVSKLTRELNCCAIFFPDFFTLQDLFTGKVKEIGTEQDGLYTLGSRV
ncbi:hypothetical protein KY285_019202 [Solanum tuberosum]|nr:hypothetical protein KY285_019202 [Solanum tuberosum]